MDKRRVGKPVAVEDFIWLVLMCTWLHGLFFGNDRPLEVVEFFAGIARVSQLAAQTGYETRAFDIDYHRPSPGLRSVHSEMPRRSCMDLNGEAGMVFPVWFSAPLFV